MEDDLTLSDEEGAPPLAPARTVRLPVISVTRNGQCFPLSLLAHVQGLSRGETWQQTVQAALNLRKSAGLQADGSYIDGAGQQRIAEHLRVDYWLVFPDSRTATPFPVEGGERVALLALSGNHVNPLATSPRGLVVSV